MIPPLPPPVLRAKETRFNIYAPKFRHFPIELKSLSNQKQSLHKNSFLIISILKIWKISSKI